MYPVLLCAGFASLLQESKLALFTPEGHENRIGRFFSRPPVYLVTMNDFGSPQKRSVSIRQPGNIWRSFFLDSHVTLYL
jgi:hypothetical protein